MSQRLAWLMVGMVLSGSPGVLAQELAVDHPESPENRIHALKFARAEEVAKTLAEKFKSSQPPIRFEIEERTNILLARATPRQHQEIDAVLKRLDARTTEVQAKPAERKQPSQKPEPAAGVPLPYGSDTAQLQVRVWWIANAPNKAGAQVPEGFKNLAGDFERLGLDSPIVVAQAMATTLGGGKFHATGQLDLDGRRPFHFCGAVEQASGKLVLHADLSVGGPGGDKSNLAAIKTQVMLKPEQFLILGTVPVDKTQTAFVVQIGLGQPTGTPKPGKQKAQGIPEMTWQQAFDWLTEFTGLPVVGEARLVGEFKPGKQPTSSPNIWEVLDLFNEQLVEQNLLLLRGERSLSLVAVGDKIEPALVPRVHITDLKKRGKSELVTITVALVIQEAPKVAQAVKKMVSPFGSVVALPESNRLVITDQAGLLLQICGILLRDDIREEKR